MAQLVLERAHHRRGEARELQRADQRNDVPFEVLPVVVERRPLQPGRLARLRTIARPASATVMLGLSAA